MLLCFYFFLASWKQTRVQSQDSCCRVTGLPPNQTSAGSEAQVISPAPLLSPQAGLVVPWPPAKKPWAPERKVGSCGAYAEAGISLVHYPIKALPLAFFLFLDRYQVRESRPWRLCSGQRLQPTPFSKPSQSPPFSSVYFWQPCAKHSINHAASASFPAKWVPDALCRPWTKWGKKNFTQTNQQRKHN